MLGDQRGVLDYTNSKNFINKSTPKEQFIQKNLGKGFGGDALFEMRRIE